jgi:hypothetical protein
MCYDAARPPLTKEESFMVAAYLEAIAPARPLADNETATHEGGIAFRADKWDRLRRKAARTTPASAS